MSGAYRTQQERVDALTMHIDDRTGLVGSGFRQLPPQVPFQGNRVLQPPTCAACSLGLSVAFRGSLAASMDCLQEYRDRPSQGAPQVQQQVCTQL